QKEMVNSFNILWPQILAGEIKGLPGKSGGSFHEVNDRKQIEHLIKEKGWDTKVDMIIGRNYNI
ncbi:hypothetical protein QUF70_20995, partial [Desulfobacterales bacterium HSG17]|nr:hypothetical protein [Desulfobacterales bacterium HSG17]